MGQDGGVQSVARAIGLVEALAASGPLGVSELAERVSLPTATVHRLLATLATAGWVRRDPATRRYVPGSGLVRLGLAARAAVGPMVQPALAEVAHRTGETANYAVLEDDAVTYLAQHESAHMVRMFTEVGNRVPPHATAVGKVLLSDRPAGEVDALLARTGLPAQTPRTITDAGRLRDALAEVARAGYAVDDEEQELGVRCVAVPVIADGHTVAALSVSGPAGRLDAERQRGAIAALRQAATTIAAGSG